MAIELRERKSNISWFGLFAFLFLLIVVVGGAYFLFFTATPGVEVIAPSVLKSTSELAEVEFDPSEVINHPRLKGLKQFGGLPTIGSTGRLNPLIGF